MVPGAASRVASRQGPSGNERRAVRKSRGVHAGWGAAAEVDGFGTPLPGVRADLALKRGPIARFEGAREDSRREIAVGTLLGAERVREVDAGHFIDCSE